VRPILFDADAFNCVRNLSILQLLREAPAPETPFAMTEYVARHELHDVYRDVAALELEGRLKIMPVSRRKTDPAGARFRTYQAERLDKGESESLAWVMGVDGERPLFITNDVGATRGFRRHGAPVGDVMDLVVEAIASGCVDRSAARERIASAWDERPNHQCRPSDYDTFDSTYDRRLRQRP
jgi:hypothetical protein